MKLQFRNCVTHWLYLSFVHVYTVYSAFMTFIHKLLLYCLNLDCLLTSFLGLQLWNHEWDAHHKQPRYLLIQNIKWCSVTLVLHCRLQYRKKKRQKLLTECICDGLAGSTCAFRSWAARPCCRPWVRLGLGLWWTACCVLPAGCLQQAIIH